MSGLTPSQTVGPYFRIGLDWPDAWRLAVDHSGGPRITLRGQVLDGDGVPVTDALIEIWQADSDGRYHAVGAGGFRGVGRCAVDGHGGFRFETVMPGRVVAPDTSLQAPHVNVLVLARGLLQQLYTRIYFAADAALHATDVVLACVPARRRATLIAAPAGDEQVFDIHLQGERETVFFEL